MDLTEVRGLLEAGDYDEAERQTVAISGGVGPAEVRAEAFLLAAEAAAKQGSADRAEDWLKRAMETAPDSVQMQRAALNLGKVYLRRNEVSLAEQVFLEALARHKGNSVLTAHAMFGLGQVYDAQHRWSLAADMYQQAAAGYALAHQWDWVVSAQLNLAWAKLMDIRTADAGVVLDTAKQMRAHATERQWHILQALRAYHLHLAGTTAEAADLVAVMIASGGPSAFATCLAAVTAGLLAHHSGMAPEVTKALKLAESVMLQASHETGSTDIINLVNELRSRAA